MPQPDLKSLVLAGMSDASLLPALENDFEEVVFDTYPEIRGIRDWMRDSGSALSLLSGSGSSVFGLFAHPERAAEALEVLTRRGHHVSLTPPGFRPS